MKRKILFSLLLLLLKSYNSFSQNCNIICNGDFENPYVSSAPYFMTDTVIQCWHTTATDGFMELWNSGYNGVSSYSGNQFMEMEAFELATIYQDITLSTGNNVSISFAHRGRAGVDTLSVSIGYIGGTDSILGYFADGDTSWGYYTVNYAFQNVGNYRVSFNTVYAAGNDPGLGNFLDAVELCTTTVGINEMSEENIFSVSSNPSTGNLTVKYNLAKDANITLYDLTGKTILSQKLNKSKQYLKVESLSKGLYLIKVSGKSFSQCKKTIVE